MNPVVHVSPMIELSPQKRKKLCEHQPPCDKYIMISTYKDGTTMCEKDAIRYSDSIYESLNVLPKVTIYGKGWSEEHTRDLIEYIRSNDVRYGTYAELAKLFGKTVKQVKNYVYYLRRKGAF